jgi:hypothetical protein
MRHKRKIKYAKDQLQRYDCRLNNYGTVAKNFSTAKEFFNATNEQTQAEKAMSEVIVIGTQLKAIDLEFSN